MSEQLTKREQVAAMAMQGILANPGFVDISSTNVAREAVAQTDKLLAHLDATAPKPDTSHIRPLPEGVPEPPEGMVYLGRGGEFQRLDGGRTFDGMATVNDPSPFWIMCLKGWFGEDLDSHYAAPADSEIVRINRKGGEA